MYFEVSETQSDWVTGPTGTQSPSRGLEMVHPYLTVMRLSILSSEIGLRSYSPIFNITEWSYLVPQKLAHKDVKRMIDDRCYDNCVTLFSIRIKLFIFDFF